MTVDANWRPSREGVLLACVGVFWACVGFAGCVHLWGW